MVGDNTPVALREFQFGLASEAGVATGHVDMSRAFLDDLHVHLLVVVLLFTLNGNWSQFYG
ncbi:hypothetical protein D3C86_2042310 [compost metagenome]